MNHIQQLFEEALGEWYGTREGVIAEISNLPDESFDFRPHPDSRTVGELGMHIAASTLVFAGELERPEGDFWRQGLKAFYAEFAGHLPASGDRDAVLERLDATRAEALERIRALGAEHMLGGMRGISGERTSRLKVLNFAIAHEMYHRGQIAIYARLQGRVPALTQALTAMAATAARED